MSRRLHISPRQAIFGIVSLLLLAVLAGGYLVSLTDPKEFHSHWLGIWWALSTVSTVGYGDLVPQSALGKGIGAVLMLIALTTVALVTILFASLLVIRHVEELEEDEREELRILKRIEQSLERLEGLNGHEDAETSTDDVPESPDNG